MVAKILRVDERLTAVGAREPPLSGMRSAQVRFHVDIAGERLAANWAHDAACVLTPVIGALPRRLDLLATQPALVHVAVDVQALMLVQVPATDEPAPADFALERSVPGVGAAVDGQQAGTDERPPTDVARERLRDRRGAMEGGIVRAHTALEGKSLGAGRTPDPTSMTADGPEQVVRAGVLVPGVERSVH